MCSNVYDDVTDFEVCGLIKNRKTKYLRKKHYFVFK